MSSHSAELTDLLALTHCAWWEPWRHCAFIAHADSVKHLLQVHRSGGCVTSRVSQLRPIATSCVAPVRRRRQTTTGWLHAAACAWRPSTVRCASSSAIQVPICTLCLAGIRVSASASLPPYQRLPLSGHAQPIGRIADTSQYHVWSAHTKLCSTMLTCCILGQVPGGAGCRPGPGPPRGGRQRPGGAVCSWRPGRRPR